MKRGLPANTCIGAYYVSSAVSVRERGGRKADDPKGSLALSSNCQCQRLACNPHPLLIGFKILLGFIHLLGFTSCLVLYSCLVYAVIYYCSWLSPYRMHNACPCRPQAIHPQPSDLLTAYVCILVLAVTRDMYVVLATYGDTMLLQRNSSVPRVRWHSVT